MPDDEILSWDENDRFIGPDGDVWEITQYELEANELSLANLRTEEVKGFTDEEFGWKLREGIWQFE